MTNFIIPFIVLFVIIYGLKNRVNIYDSFLEGVNEGLSLILKIFPTMFAMTISINVLLKSNIINDVVNLFSNFFNYIGYPKELVSLGIMRPISGSSSLIILNNILNSCGVDSLAGRVGSVLQGSTDTTIYIISLYFSSVGIKKIRYSLLVGLLTDFAAIVISFFVIKILFY
ncbi:MAG: spore maturation protein [Bacilli bacterium]|nr:spore maturation protein [Bacilli bacterium]